MKRKNIQKKGSAGLTILEYLFYYGSINRKDVHLLLGYEKHKNTIIKAINNLLSYGFIKVIDTKPKKIIMTEDGLNHLARSDKYYEINRGRFFKYNLTNNENQKQEKDNQLTAFMFGGMNWTFPREKPTLNCLIRTLSQKDNVEEATSSFYWTPEGEDSVKEKLVNGIYYTADEVRTAFKDRLGPETIYRSRFSGILLTENKLYIAYHIQKGLIKWVAPAEDTLIIALEKLLENVSVYSFQKPACIAIGNCTMQTGIASLATGFKNGKVKNKKSLDNETAQAAMNLFTAKTTLFSEMYFCSYSKEGVEQFTILISGTQETRMIGMEKWMYDFTDYQLTDKFFPDAVTSEGEPVIYYPVPELRKLYLLRIYQHFTEPAIIITSPALANGVSQTLGERVKKMISISDCKEIDYISYDAYGYSTEERENERTKNQTQKKSVQSSVIHIPKELYDKIKRTADEQSITISEMGASIINEYFTQKMID